jgi:dTDP-4-dehydrorhamnose 3,5-epimerase
VRTRQTAVMGAYVLEVDRLEDERGFFARMWDLEQLQAGGMAMDMVQANIGFSRSKGTLRGLHYQTAPHQEAKLVRCTMGAAFDVILDLRADSPTFMRWAGVSLSAEERNMVFVPPGCAHGYMTLEDSTEMFYPVSRRYVPQAERGVRWDDPAFGIDWPMKDGLIISVKDRSWPDFHPGKVPAPGQAGI